MRLLIAALLFGGTLISCTRESTPREPDPYTRSILEWREQRLTRLKSETGWLTLVGLSWLKQGVNRCGSDQTLEVVFPEGTSPALAGRLTRTGDVVRFEAEEGVRITLGDSAVTSIEMRSDENGAQEPTILRHGTLSFYVIKRGGELGVRVKDSASPMRMNFQGLEYFPVDTVWRKMARFKPYDPPRVLMVQTTGGVAEEFRLVGRLSFRHGDSVYTLDAAHEAGEATMLIMFMDGTSGRETYGGGRQLYASPPDSTNTVLLDFNKAYNWPCVFTDFATCPIPPPQNRLELRVEAGEKMYSGHE